MYLSFHFILKLYLLACHILPVQRYEYREPALQEAVLLLVRALLEVYPSACLSDGSWTGSGISCIGMRGHVVFSLVYLQARCPGEGDIVSEAASR